MPLLLTPDQDAAIRAHAEADYPHECCGFLLGTVGGAAVTVHRTAPAGNTRQDSPRNRFEIDPGEMVRVDRAARSGGIGVVGFYHSHPDAPAVPSRFDREHAWAGYCYAIVSVQAGQAEDIHNWTLRDDAATFAPDAVLIQENHDAR